MFLSEQEYQQVIALIDGKELPNEFLKKFKNWFKERFQLELYEFFTDHLDNGTPRLRLIIWDYESYRAMHDQKSGNFDPKKQKIIRQEFALLAKENNSYQEFQDEDKVFVCYETIADEIAQRIFMIADKEIMKIKLPDIGKIDICLNTVNIFYLTDQQLKTHKTDGENEEINKLVTNIVKPYDKYGVFNKGIQCVFTSLQTLKEKYDNNLFYYYR